MYVCVIFLSLYGVTFACHPLARRGGLSIAKPISVHMFLRAERLHFPLAVRIKMLLYALENVMTGGVGEWLGGREGCSFTVLLRRTRTLLCTACLQSVQVHTRACGKTSRGDPEKCGIHVCFTNVWFVAWGVGTRGCESPFPSESFRVEHTAVS